MTVMGALVERIAKLEAEVAELKARAVVREPQAEPVSNWSKPRLDENLDAGVVQPWMKDMAAAVSDREMADIVKDLRNGPPRPSSGFGPKGE